jgi:superfamily II DNA/RNA helicase
MTLLEELLEEHGTKAVVFSQWLGTHELIERRLAARDWGHVLFHGSVPAEQRGELVRRFREEPGCRVFLSTDAGGVGLNLQQAATVINMDLPWNPAVLEQRIGRVHRMGQRRKVQVVNFIAQGTIEEGMLSLLGFKKSLFAGVLDGGNAEVFLNGTRLSRFMEGVEKATGAIGQAEIQQEALEAPAPPLASPASADVGTDAGERTEDASVRAPSADPWKDLLDAGLRLVAHLAQRPAHSNDSPTSRPAWLETDPETGRSYLRLPVPEAQTVVRLADVLEELLSARQRG